MKTMQIEILPSAERGVTNNGWLDSRHSFNFGDYFETERLNFGTLRVFNEDIVKGGKGFDEHPHENMEILTVVLEGSLKHKDSTGSESTLAKGDVQRMSAGTGVTHSEYNASSEEPVHFFQIWIYPKERGLAPSYEQKHFPDTLFKNTLFPIACGKPSETSLLLNQDATLYRGDFEKGLRVEYTPGSKNHGCFLFVMSGKVSVGESILGKGDAAQISHSDGFEIEILSLAKILLVELSLFGI